MVVIPAPLASEARERDQAGTHAQLGWNVGRGGRPFRTLESISRRTITVPGPQARPAGRLSATLGQRCLPVEKTPLELGKELG